ncbi:MAG TPA: Asp-tRNA(Asn)/Glu-tRNA(Gln) amidotransferase subunit GatC [Armatimonadota bacterium]|nr:Asp-tRNA(Asn)/Glu-tRNA(Gln) amidotransferase subunit GatC [Armatimonadota bacterium]
MSENNQKKLSVDDVRQVGHLSRLALTESEVERLTNDLNVLLGHFEQLREIDTTEVPPTFQVLDSADALRADEVLPSLAVEQVLSNAPDADGPFFVVPRIVETDSAG